VPSTTERHGRNPPRTNSAAGRRRIRGNRRGDAARRGASTPEKTLSGPNGRRPIVLRKVSRARTVSAGACESLSIAAQAAEWPSITWFADRNDSPRTLRAHGCASALTAVAIMNSSSCEFARGQFDLITLRMTRSVIRSSSVSARSACLGFRVQFSPARRGAFDARHQFRHVVRMSGSRRRRSAAGCGIDVPSALKMSTGHLRPVAPHDCTRASPSSSAACGRTRRDPTATRTQGAAGLAAVPETSTPCGPTSRRAWPR